MKKTIRYLFVIYAILAAGCSIADRKTAVLWTNKPEAAAYVEMFNAVQSDYRIELVYAEEPSAIAGKTYREVPDIVIADNLSSGSLIGLFSPLNKLAEDGRLDTESIYPELYSLGMKDGDILVLPLAFNLPAIMYKTGTLEQTEGLIISPEELKTEAGAFNEKSSKNFRVKGFLPGMNPEFIHYTAVINGAGFSETADGSLKWNSDILETSIAFCRDWTESVNGGFEEEKDFDQTYCYDPSYKLLNSGRLGFHYTDLRSFFAVPAEERKSLDFLWLGNEGRIPVCEDILYIGIPRQSRKKKPAEAFLLWLISEDAQKELIKSSQYKRTRTFGFFDGFSSLHLINELVLPEFYTLLIGNIPPADYLDFPERLPPEWNGMKNRVLLPWLQNAAGASPGSQDLAESIRKWLIQGQ